MNVKTANIAGTTAWSPLKDKKDLLLAGTVSGGGLDFAAASTSTLELFSVDLASDGARG